jgi:hypothetical protein
MKIEIKNMADIEKVKRIIDSSKTYFYRAHVEVVNRKFYIVFSQLDRK